MPWSLTLTLRRTAVSAFLIGHLSAVLIFILPGGALKERLTGWNLYYLMPTGLWQYWGMFAPDPVKETVALEGVAVDRRGMIRRFDFPRMADKTPWEGILGYRHAKFTANIALPEFRAHREFAARHVIRQLKFAEDDFPVIVQLQYRVWASPEPGEPPVDLTAEPSTFVVESYRYPTLDEAQP